MLPLRKFGRIEGKIWIHYSFSLLLSSSSPFSQQAGPSDCDGRETAQLETSLPFGGHCQPISCHNDSQNSNLVDVHISPKFVQSNLHKFLCPFGSPDVFPVFLNHILPPFFIPFLSPLTFHFDPSVRYYF